MTDIIRVAMWSGPRNISTAMMRAFENRPDCAVVDEPLYAHYLSSTGLDHPGADAIKASQSCDWQQVVEQLLHQAPAPCSVFYQKHMTQHLLPGMALDFVDQLQNCFLIREPRRIVASYARVRPQFTIEEMGFRQQWQVFEREAQRTGAAPPVLDSATVLADPGRSLQALCDGLGIGFMDAMLQWPRGARDSDGVWAPHWYSAVEASTGFARPEAEGPLPEVPACYEAMCQEAEDIYQRLLVHALGRTPTRQEEGVS